ncbi:hypothetical protein D3C80_1656350 [compost metagenome]
MLKERFLFVANLIKDGTIEILSRDQNGRVDLRIPKYLWLQLTPKDIRDGVQGRFSEDISKRVSTEVLREDGKSVEVCLVI